VEEETERIAAFLRGEPRPEWSVRTSPWLARIAARTAAGRSWRRVHVVRLPLSDYLRYELVGYVESQACGEQIRITDQSAGRADAIALGDFWLFDADTPAASAIDMSYDANGSWTGADLVTDARQLNDRHRAAERIWSAGTPLNHFLATVSRIDSAGSA
jgi:Family of unknown function (DUF6879)